MLVIETSLTAATVNVAPATLWLALFSNAWPTRESTASVVPPATSMVPAFSVSASVAMLRPLASVSLCTTV